MHQLSAFGTGNDSDALKCPFALADSLEKGGSLGAVAGGVSSVLNVAATIDSAALPFQRCTHPEVGIGRIGQLSLAYITLVCVCVCVCVCV